MKAKRRPKTSAPAEPPPRQGLEALRHYGDALYSAVQWMQAHLDEEPDLVKREQLGVAITIGYFEAICAIYIPECRQTRSKERAFVEDMARSVDWSQYPPATAG